MYQTETQRRLIFESCQRAWDNMIPDDPGYDDEENEEEHDDEVEGQS